jgi:hypothetical protein
MSSPEDQKSVDDEFERVRATMAESQRLGTLALQDAQACALLEVELLLANETMATLARADWAPTEAELAGARSAIAAGQ